MFLKLCINSWLFNKECFLVFLYITYHLKDVTSQLLNKIVHPNKVCIFLIFRVYVLKIKEQVSMLFGLFSVLDTRDFIYYLLTSKKIRNKFWIERFNLNHFCDMRVVHTFVLHIRKRKTKIKFAKLAILLRLVLSSCPLFSGYRVQGR